MTTIEVQTPPRGAQVRRYLARYAIVWVTLALFIFLAATTQGFLTTQNLTNILAQQATVLIVAVPFTLLMIAGSFDISLSAVYVAAPIVGIQLQIATGSIWLAVFGGIAFGIVCGVVNAIVVVRFNINSFIATLATSFIIFGVGYLVSGQSIVVPTDPDFRGLAMTRIFGITSATWFALIVVAIFWVLLARTRYGRYVYATGASPEAARLSGVRAGWIVASTFLLAGGAAGFAGVLLNASRSVSAQASDDFTFVFGVIAAVVVGGTSIAGGSGAVWRTVVGVVFIALLNNGFNLNQVDPIIQRIILGCVILLAVGIDAVTRRGKAG